MMTTFVCLLLIAMATIIDAAIDCTEYCDNEHRCGFITAQEPWCSCKKWWTGNRCEIPFSETLKTINDSLCFYHIHITKDHTYEEAKEFCSHYGMLLVKIPNGEVHDGLETYVKRLFPFEDRYLLWLGVESNDEHWTFLDGSHVPFTPAYPERFPLWTNPPAAFTTFSRIALDTAAVSINIRQDFYWTTLDPSTKAGFICERFGDIVNKQRPCQYNQCLNGRTCNDIGCSFQCQCLPSQHPPLCQQEESCLSIPCQNRGRCEQAEGWISCDCPRNHDGNRCQETNFQVVGSNDKCSFHSRYYGFLSTYQDSKRACQKLGGALASIKNLLYQTTIEDQVEKAFGRWPNMQFWIGGEDDGQGEYRDLFGDVIPTQSTRQSYPRWGRDKPSTDRKPYIKISRNVPAGENAASSGMYWTDADDTEVAGYVCERPESGSVCESNPCKNGGTCINLGCRFKCTCPENAVGETCSECVDSRPCDKNCLNGGMCERSNNECPELYQCNCPGTTAGVNCQICLARKCHCLNGGQCLDPNPCSSRCLCQPGYSGLRCETCIAAPCESSPCKNGGTCFLLLECSSEFICECLDNSEGEMCERCKKEPCSDNPCSNRGTCIKENCNYRCECNMYRYGDHCEHCLLPSCNEAYCQYGSKCLANDACSPDNMQCMCTKHNKGEFCQDAVYLPSGDESCLVLLRPAQPGKDPVFYRAPLWCEKDEGRLLMIKSAERQEIIQKMAKEEFEDRDVFMWVGAEYKNGKWVWLDGEPLPEKAVNGYPRWDTGSLTDLTNKPYLMLSTKKGLSISENPDKLLYWTNAGNEINAGYGCEKRGKSRDLCSSNPCQYGGLCELFGCSFKCICVDGRYGRTCTKASLRLLDAQPIGVVLKDTFTLSCSFKGIPTPIISWEIFLENQEYPYAEPSKRRFKDVEGVLGLMVSIQTQEIEEGAMSTLSVSEFGLCIGSSVIACKAKNEDSNQVLKHEFSVNSVYQLLTDDRYYTFSMISEVTSKSAKRLCNSIDHGDLATIRSATISDKFGETLRLLDMYVPNYLAEVWINRETSGDYSNWKGGEPQKDCAFVGSDLRWETEGCSDTSDAHLKNFVCEAPNRGKVELYNIETPYGSGDQGTIIIKIRLPNGLLIISYSIETTSNYSYRSFDIPVGSTERTTGELSYTVTDLRPETEYHLQIFNAPSLCAQTFREETTVVTAAANKATLFRNDSSLCVVAWDWPSTKDFPVTEFKVAVSITPFLYNKDTQQQLVEQVARESFTESLAAGNRQYSFQTKPNRLHEVTVTSTSSSGKSFSTSATGECISSVSPALLRNTPQISNENVNSLTYTIYPADETNGPVSCYFVLSAYFDEETPYAIPETTKSYFDKINSYYPYKGHPAGREYIALALPSEFTEASDELLGDNRETSCDVLNIRGNTSRSKRQAEKSVVYRGKNLPLKLQKHYKVFLVTTTPGLGGELLFTPSEKYSKFEALEKDALDNFILVPLVVLLAGFLILVAFFVKRKAIKKRGKFNLQKILAPDERFEPLMKNNKDITILSVDIEKLQRMKEGKSAEHWKVRIYNKRFPSIEAYAKVLAGAASSSQERHDFAIEIEAMRSFTNGQFVVQLLCLSLFENPSDENVELFAMMEIFPKGTLYAYLKNCRPTASGEKVANKLGTSDMCHFASDIAKAMEYISDRGFIHRVLYGRNVLLTDKLACRVADFSHIRPVNKEGQYTFHDFKLSTFYSRWMAPEAYFESIFSKASDVWSFGVTMWEIFAFGYTPYKRAHGNSLKKEVVERNLRLHRPKYCPNQIYDMMQGCWQITPSFRPTFKELKEKLSQPQQNFVPQYSDIGAESSFFEDVAEDPTDEVDVKIFLMETTAKAQETTAVARETTTKGQKRFGVKKMKGKTTGV